MKYEKWSFGYWLLKQYILFANWLIYNKTVMQGLENIPKNRPILFAPNHQNALSDPMAILLNTKYQPVWLARADIFNNKFASSILRFMKIMPVYRMRDGKENLRKNDKTFKNSIKVLENNFALALFPEASHSGRRQMLSHKKAVPRIVFMAEEKAGHNLDIQIVPTGIYYSSYWKFNRNLIVNFGAPIAVNEYLEDYKKNPKDTIMALRERIHNEMLPLVLEIKSTKNYHDFEMIRELYGQHFLNRQKQPHSMVNLFSSDQKLVAKLDELETKRPEETEEIVREAKLYNDKLKSLKIRNWLIENYYNNFWKFDLNNLKLILAFPIFLYGLLFNAVPFFLIDIPVRKKVKDKAFWSTFFLTIGLVLFPVSYLLELWAVWVLLPGIWLKLAFLATLPFAGKLAFKWYILFRKTSGRARLFLLKMFNRKEYYNIFKQYELLFRKLDGLIQE